MLTTNSEHHLRLARQIADPRGAIAEYMLAIDAAVRELKDSAPANRSPRSR